MRELLRLRQIEKKNRSLPWGMTLLRLSLRAKREIFLATRPWPLSAAGSLLSEDERWVKLK
jgi:hypothetical protein